MLQSGLLAPFVQQYCPRPPFVQQFGYAESGAPLVQSGRLVVVVVVVLVVVLGGGGRLIKIRDIEYKKKLSLIELEELAFKSNAFDIEVSI